MNDCRTFRSDLTDREMFEYHLQFHWSQLRELQCRVKIIQMDYQQMIQNGCTVQEQEHIITMFDRLATDIEVCRGILADYHEQGVEAVKE